MVFKNNATIVRELCNKARSLTLETILVKRQKEIDITDLYVEERKFIAYMLDNSNSWQKGSYINRQLNNSNYSWKLRLKDGDFTTWLGNSNVHYLFFDGASKSNNRIAGSGGIIYNANGEIQLSYEWGLGHLSNNRDKALALYQGLVQLRKLGINATMVLGDSASIISLMVTIERLPICYFSKPSPGVKQSLNK